MYTVGEGVTPPLFTGWCDFKLKLKLPKITIGDPTKLITKPIEGVQNAFGSIGGNALDNVGNLLSNPAAAPVLGAAGTAFGGPAMGGLFGSLAGNFSKKSEPASEQATPVPIQIGQGPRAKDNTLLYVLIGSGVFGVLIMVLFLKSKRRR